MMNYWRTSLESAGERFRGRIKFPHMESKIVSHGSHLSKHITHCIEDNAKLHAELEYPWSEGRKDKASIHELSTFYMDLAFWVIVADYFKVVIDNKGHVQELLNRAWKEIEAHPELTKTGCDDCKAKKVGRCTG